MPLYLYNGILLTEAGSLAAGTDCCCELPTEEPTPTPTPPECPGGFSALGGWYTEDGQADMLQLLTDAGYTNIQFIPTAPFVGAPIPYTDGCGQTFYDITADCLCESGDCNDPIFTTANISRIFGPGNQFPPCGGPTIEETSVRTCCNPPPP